MPFQIGASQLDFLVLAVLRREDTYGYVLTQQAREVLEISDSTLYPVLKRLQKEGCLQTYDRPFQGRNRRYYSLTPAGGRLLEHYIRQWEAYKAGMDRILMGKGLGDPDGQINQDGGESHDTG